MMPCFSSSLINSTITMTSLKLISFGLDIIQLKSLMPPQKLVPSGEKMFLG
jgi:hypothetical protein